LLGGQKLCCLLDDVVFYMLLLPTFAHMKASRPLILILVTNTTRKPLIHPPQKYQCKLDQRLKDGNTNQY